MEQMLNVVEGVGLDWSGVVSFDLYVVYLCNKTMLEERGKKSPSFAEWLHMSQANVCDLLKVMGCPPEDPEAVYNEYRRNLAAVKATNQRPTLYPGAREFIEELVVRSIPIDIISSHPQEDLEEEARRYGIHPLINRFYGNVTDKAKVIEDCARGYEPGTYWYFGDMIFDVQAAKKAKVCSVGVAGGYHSFDRLVAENPTLVIGSLLEGYGQMKKLAAA